MCEREKDRKGGRGRRMEKEAYGNWMMESNDTENTTAVTITSCVLNHYSLSVCNSNFISNDKLDFLIIFLYFHSLMSFSNVLIF